MVAMTSQGKKQERSPFKDQYGDLEKYLAYQYGEAVKEAPVAQTATPEVLEQTMNAMAFSNMLARPYLGTEAKFGLLAHKVSTLRQHQSGTKKFMA
ncbi:MAG: hypothetical protein ACKO37_05800 [Vampirovibrionales bacterium]